MQRGRILFLLAVTVVIFITLSALPSSAQTAWANSPANLTVGELLSMFFEAKLSRQESQALNSYNLVSFYPSGISDQAIVMVTQTWHDNKASSAADLRKGIRDVSSSLYELFQALSRTRLVRARWSIGDPSRCFVIKHVRHADLDEVLAVTVGATTWFDVGQFDSVKAYVENFGGVW